MVLEETLKQQFHTLGVVVEDKAFLDKCQDLCNLYNVSEEVLVEMWMAFVAEKNAGLVPTLSTLTQMERAVLEKKSKSTLKAKIDSPAARRQSQSTNRDYDDDDDILEMYGYKEPKRQQVKRLRSPEEPNLSVEQKSKKRALEATASLPDGYAIEPQSPGSEIDEDPKSSGSVLRKFGKVVRDWKTTTNQWQVAIAKTADPHVPARAMYMFELLSKKSCNLQKVCREFGARLCSTWSKNTSTNKCPITANVATQSQITFRTWGRILAANNGKLSPAVIKLEGCKTQPHPLLPSVVSIDLTNLPSYSVFPGQILAVEGTNPTRSTLVARTLFASGYPPPSPEPKIQENLHIIVAAGPFTTPDNLDYKPLFKLMKSVAELEPHVLILLGPFLSAGHPKIRKFTTCDTFQQLFEQLVEKIIKFIKGKCTQVVLIPSSQDVHHDPVYPTPEFFLPKNLHSPNLHLMPDPCMLDIEGIVIGATSVDIIRHLSSEEMNKNMSGGEERPARLSSHILSQACFYPLYPPSPQVNLDTGLWEKYAFMYQQPHILILPSDMRNFFKWTQNCFVINPERLNKRMYARMIVKPSLHQPWSNENIDCEILKL